MMFSPRLAPSPVTRRATITSGQAERIVREYLAREQLFRWFQAKWPFPEPPTENDRRVFEQEYLRCRTTL